MLLFELFERIQDPKQAVLDAALAALHRRVSSKGDQQTIDGYAFDIARSFNIGMNARQLAALYRERYSVNEGYRLQLERDDAVLVLNITDTDTGKRTEVRGKPGYETSGYDPTDKLHMLLDKIGKTANISELINGETVTINPKHPDAERAKSATDRAFNEDTVVLTKKNVEENFTESKYGAPFTFKIKRRKLNVPALIKAGAIFITYPHGEQGWETDDNRVWSYSLISLYNVQGGGWPKDAKKYLKPQSYKRAEQQINSSAPNLGSDQLVYDGKYNQILWSIKKLGIPDNVAFLDNSQQDVAENFADGKVKGKSRPGRVKRAGASCDGSVTELRKRAKNSSGEKAKMYHWCANMKSGRKKS